MFHKLIEDLEESRSIVIASETLQDVKTVDQLANVVNGIIHRANKSNSGNLMDL